ncbi:MAG: aminotransferase class I/II-fold pyridoxal phosphate-dependent enzyme [Acidobacteria bacterium]|nr:aminotransferase class I/II-fold pyridoxal phosphate-dependent enzyme [Acidobacteriota bacterium]
MMRLDSKLPSVGTTIFTIMSRLATELGAINLSQGFPDFDCDPALIDAVAHHMRAGRNQYSPMLGVLPLREAIAARYADVYSQAYDADSEVTITSGGTEALFNAVAAMVHPGDEAIVLEPCYDSYLPAITLSGGVTGSVLGPADIAALRDIVAATNIVIVSDEVYEHIIFDGLTHESMARYPDLAARSFIVGSFGKTYHVTGWKVGYAVAPSALTAEFRKVHQFVTFSTHTPTQYALADFLAARRGLAELGPFYEAKRNLFLRLMEGSRFRPLPCHGSYFQLLDYSAISSESDADFAIRLTREYGVASIPTSPFLSRERAPLVLRFCFAKKEETLEAAAERLQAV